MTMSWLLNYWSYFFLSASISGFICSQRFKKSRTTTRRQNGKILSAEPKTNCEKTNIFVHFIVSVKPLPQITWVSCAIVVKRVLFPPQCTTGSSSSSSSSLRARWVASIASAARPSPKREGSTRARSRTTLTTPTQHARSIREIPLTYGKIAPKSPV